VISATIKQALIPKFKKLTNQYKILLVKNTNKGIKKTQQAYQGRRLSWYTLYIA